MKTSRSVFQKPGTEERIGESVSALVGVKDIQFDHAEDRFANAARVGNAGLTEEVFGKRLSSAEAGNTAQNAHLYGRKTCDNWRVGLRLARKDELKRNGEIRFGDDGAFFRRGPKGIAELLNVTGYVVGKVQNAVEDFVGDGTSPILNRRVRKALKSASSIRPMSKRAADL